LKKVEREKMIHTLKREWCGQQARGRVRDGNPDWEWDRAGFADDVAEEMNDRFYLVWNDQRQAVDSPGGTDYPPNIEECVPILQRAHARGIPEPGVHHRPKFKAAPPEAPKGRGRKIGWKPKK
jgi:hypothetical protein